MTVALPLLVALATGVILVLVGRIPRLRRAIAISGGIGYLLAAGLLWQEVKATGMSTLNFGAWDAPVGIVFVADSFSAALVGVTAIVSLATILYGSASPDGRGDEIGYLPVTFFLIAGVTGAFLTGDLFNLYVWFELILLSSFVLISLGGERRHLRSALHYVFLNLIGSAVFLSGLGLMYGATGTLNMAQLSLVVPTLPPNVAIVFSLLILLAFCIKGAIFPFSAWLPASYPAPPVATAAIFAALLTKVGVACLYRAMSLPFADLPPAVMNLLSALAIATGLIAGLAALTQNDIRRIFAFLLISHIGLMVVALPLRPAAGIAYTLQHMVVICVLYLLLGQIARFGGSFKLSELGGLGAARPWLGTVFVVAGFSLAGVPPLSGFWPKVGMMQAAVQERDFFALGLVVVVGVLTLAAVVRVWQTVFWRPAPGDLPNAWETPVRRVAMVGSIAVLFTLSLIAALVPGSWYDAATAAADQMARPEQYRDALLSEELAR